MVKTKLVYFSVLKVRLQNSFFRIYSSQQDQHSDVLGVLKLQKSLSFYRLASGVRCWPFHHNVGIDKRFMPEHCLFVLLVQIMCENVLFFFK